MTGGGRGRLGRVAALGALLLFALPAGAAWGGLADRVGTTFVLMAEDFIKNFQPIEGLVVSQQGDVLYLDVGSGAGARVGQELTVFRKGDVFNHPLTGRPLGRYEETLGYAQIRRIQPRFSEAAFIPVPGKAAPRPEDGVRITRGRIRVAVTPALDLTRSDADLRRIPYLLAGILERSKRFQVLDPLTVSDALTSGFVRVGEVLARPERALGLNGTLQVAGWVVPVLLERRGTVYLDVTWISAVTGTALISRREPLVPTSATEEQRFPWEPRVED